MPNPLFRKKSISAILADAQTGLSDATHSSSGLNKVLTVRDLTAMGIAAVVGATDQAAVGVVGGAGQDDLGVAEQ